MKRTLKIDFDIECKRCGKKGATEGGTCLGCITLALEQGEFDHLFDKNRQPKKEDEK